MVYIDRTMFISIISLNFFQNLATNFLSQNIYKLEPKSYKFLLGVIKETIFETCKIMCSNSL